MIKTVLSAESSLASLHHNNVASRYSCFELFGFDILLDSKLKPWLLEVNISPSLHSSSTLDLDVKSPLATELFNMARSGVQWSLSGCLVSNYVSDYRYHIPNRLKLKEQTEVAAKMGYSNITQLCFDGGSTSKKSPRLRRINRKCSCRNPTAQTPPFLPRVKFAGGWDGLLTDWLLRYPGQSHSGRREATRGERGRAGHQSEIHQDISNSAHSQVLQVSQNLKIPLSKMWRHLKRIHQIDLLVRFISLLLINTRNNLIEIGFFFLLQKIYIS